MNEINACKSLIVETEYSQAETLSYSMSPVLRSGLFFQILTKSML